LKQAVSRDFEAVARACLPHWRPGRSERYVDYVSSRLESDVFPEIGSRPASEVTAVEFRNVAQKIERRGALEMARRLLQNYGQIMRYGVRMTWFSAIPRGSEACRYSPERSATIPG
jgi:hypothetical protein